MQKKPKVSVCIPVYNGSDYIAESVASVLAQTYENLQLLVCDNCSTDDTGKIVQGFDDPRITYVRNSRNLGLVGNTNRCIELAEGEYVGILHHDDVMMPDNIERKVCILDERPDIGFVHSNIWLIDSAGEVVSNNIWSSDSQKDYFEQGMIVFRKYLKHLPLGASIFIGAVLARRSCYDRLGLYSPQLPHCSDSEMFMRMSLFYDVACIGEPLVKYRVHQTSTSSSWGDYTSLTYLKEHFLVAKMIFERYGAFIPDADRLERKVDAAFGERLLDLAWSACSCGDFDSGKAFFKEAVVVSQGIFKNATFWKTAARLLAGPRGLNFKKIE